MALFVVENPLSFAQNFFGGFEQASENQKSRCQRRNCNKPKTSPLEKNEENQFTVSMDVKQFSPEEIKVKTVGRQVVVETKHEDKDVEHGTVSRHYVRKYTLPEDCRTDEVVSKLSSDGVLTIVAPRHKPTSDNEECVIPITISDTPCRSKK